MKQDNLEKQLNFLKRYVLVSSLLFVSILFSAYTELKNQRFGAIDVERINIIEKDGTVKMIITNQEKFPTGNELVNNRFTNKTREKRPGILFFNEEGIEAGGLIYNGKKNENGHSAGMSLTFDRYDGDQVMQMLTTDRIVKGKRITNSGLAFNEYGNDTLTQSGFSDLLDSLRSIKDPAKRSLLQKEMKEKGMFGQPRIYLGRTGDANNGLYLFDNNGMPRAMFYIDKNNQAKLEFYDDKGKVVDAWPKENR